MTYQNTTSGWDATFQSWPCHSKALKYKSCPFKAQNTHVWKLVKGVACCCKKSPICDHLGICDMIGQTSALFWGWRSKSDCYLTQHAQMFISACLSYGKIFKHSLRDTVVWQIFKHPRMAITQHSLSYKNQTLSYTGRQRARRFGVKFNQIIAGFNNDWV